MTHKKHTNTPLLIIIACILVIGVAYMVFSGSRNQQRNQNTSFGGNTSYSCPMMRNARTQGRGCGRRRNTTSTQSITDTTASSATTANIQDTTTNYETMNLGHDAYSLIPETVTLTAGKNYKLIITPSADGAGCMNNMTLPGLDNNVYPVKKDTSVTMIITNAKAGTYELVCGNMGMHQGTIMVQ